MGELTIVNCDGVNVMDSRDIAEIIGIRHDNLLSKIKGYIEVLESSKLRTQDFFIGSTYLSAQNKENPCYLLTRRGCDMVANKMIGERGILFTAAYVTKFDEMEKAIKSKMETAQLSPYLQMFNHLFQAIANNELEQKRLHEDINSAKEEAASAKQEVQAIREVINLNANQWRTEVSNIITKIAILQGGNSEDYRRVREESYELLDARAGAKLNIRLTNRRRKVLEETGSKSKSEKVSKLDCIAEDKRLTEVYLAIVKEMAIKYKVA